MNGNSPKGLFWLGVTILIWGAYMPVGKVVSQAIDPYWITGIRYLFSGAFLAIIVAAIEGPHSLVPPRKDLFALPEYSQPGRRIVDCEGIGVAVSGLRMVENFLDMGHFPYVHAHYLGEVPQTEVATYDVSVDETADEIWATNCRFYQPKTSKSATTGLDVQYRYRVVQPMGAVLYKTAVPRPGEMDAIGLFVQPHDEEHITAYCLLAYYDDTSAETDLIGFQHTIFGQDKPILENQLPKRMPLRPGTEVPTRCDAMSVAFRRWLAARGTTYGAIARDGS